MNLPQNKTYKDMGVLGLKALAFEYGVDDDIDFVKSHSDKSETILDLACGYGRVAIALAEAGYEKIYGIDLAYNLIEDAKREVKERGLKVNFVLGDMRALPYEKNMFDKIFCLWNSFNEILTKTDQIKVLNEVHRVLKPGGEAFFAIHNGEDESVQELFRSGELSSETRIRKVNFNGGDVYQYMHSRKTLKDLLDEVSFFEQSVEFVKMHNRKRILMRIKK